MQQYSCMNFETSLSQNIVEGDWLGKSASLKEQNNGARSDVEHGSHVTLTVHKQDQDGVRLRVR